MPDTFWQDMQFPFQDEDDQFQFANLVVVAEQFLRATSTAAALNEQAEVLQEQLANLRIMYERKERQLKILRRNILARNYKQMSKSAGKDVQEAFIVAMAASDGVLQELLDVEQAMEKLQQEIEQREPVLDELRNRLKTLDTIMGWGKQYLDFEKLLLRSSQYA